MRTQPNPRRGSHTVGRRSGTRARSARPALAAATAGVTFALLLFSSVSRGEDRALLLPGDDPAEKREILVIQHGHRFRAGDVLMADESSGALVAVPVGYLVEEIRAGTALYLVTGDARTRFRMKSLEPESERSSRDDGETVGSLGLSPLPVIAVCHEAPASQQSR